MKFVHALALALILIGGLNWGLVGLFDVDLVASLFGTGTLITRLIYCLVGLAAVLKICTWCRHNGECCKK